MFKRVFTTMVLAFFLAGGLVAEGQKEASDEQKGERIFISIAAEEPGGSWYAYSATLIKIIEANTPYKVEVIPRGGGIANASSVNEGKADFGFCTSNAAAWAASGFEDVYKGKKHENIRVVLNGLQYAYELMMARQSYVDKTGNTTLEAMLTGENPARIIMEPTGSQDPIIAGFIFKPFDITLQKLRDENLLSQVGSSQISQNVRDNKADLFIVNAPVGQATSTEITLTNDMYFIPYSDAVLSSLKDAGMPRATMPANIYEGQPEDYLTAVSSTILISNKDVPDEIVYNVTKALVDNAEMLKSEHAPMQVWNPQESVKPENLPLALHKGAAQFYGEKGWVQ